MELVGGSLTYTIYTREGVNYLTLREQFYANECNEGRDAPNECNSTLTSGTNNIYPYPYIDVNDRGHRFRSGSPLTNYPHATPPHVKIGAKCLKSLPRLDENKDRLQTGGEIVDNKS